MNVRSSQSAVLELLKSDHIDHTLRASFQIHTPSHISTLDASETPPSRDPSAAATAACLVLPYQSSNMQATQINQAMVAEWIHHHTSLGFNILIYDRQGSFQQATKNNNSSYALLRSMNTQSSNVIYHPYTIRELLDPLRNGKTFDNNDMNPENNANSQGNVDEKNSLVQSEAMMDVTDDDKTLTLTHCRFEAKVRQ